MQGFKLTEEMQQEGFSGGTVLCGANGEMFDVGKALRESSDGVIYTNDDLFALVLAQYPALERVPDNEVSKDATAVEVPSSPVTAQAAAPQAPWTPQTPSDTLPQVSVEVVPGEGEVAAEHADEPADENQAVQQGEAVSGLSSSGSSSAQAGEAQTGESSGSSRFSR